jgi:hypothetical protein
MPNQTFNTPSDVRKFALDELEKQYEAIDSSCSSLAKIPKAKPFLNALDNFRQKLDQRQNGPQALLNNQLMDLQDYFRPRGKLDADIKDLIQQILNTLDYENYLKDSKLGNDTDLQNWLLKIDEIQTKITFLIRDNKDDNETLKILEDTKKELEIFEKECIQENQNTQTISKLSQDINNDIQKIQPLLSKFINIADFPKITDSSVSNFFSIAANVQTYQTDLKDFIEKLEKQTLNPNNELFEQTKTVKEIKNNVEKLKEKIDNLVSVLKKKSPEQALQDEVNSLENYIKNKSTQPQQKVDLNQLLTVIKDISNTSANTLSENITNCNSEIDNLLKKYPIIDQELAKVLQGLKSRVIALNKKAEPLKNQLSQLNEKLKTDLTFQTVFKQVIEQLELFLQENKLGNKTNADVVLKECDNAISNALRIATNPNAKLLLTNLQSTVNNFKDGKLDIANLDKELAEATQELQKEYEKQETQDALTEAKFKNEEKEALKKNINAAHSASKLLSQQYSYENYLEMCKLAGEKALKLRDAEDNLITPEIQDHIGKVSDKLKKYFNMQWKKEGEKIVLKLGSNPDDPTDMTRFSKEAAEAMVRTFIADGATDIQLNNMTNEQEKAAAKIGLNHGINIEFNPKRSTKTQSYNTIFALQDFIKKRNKEKEKTLGTQSNFKELYELLDDPSSIAPPIPDELSKLINNPKYRQTCTETLLSLLTDDQEKELFASLNNNSLSLANKDLSFEPQKQLFIKSGTEKRCDILNAFVKDNKFDEVKKLINTLMPSEIADIFSNINCDNKLQSCILNSLDTDKTIGLIDCFDKEGKKFYFKDFFTALFDKYQNKKSNIPSWMNPPSQVDKFKNELNQLVTAFKDIDLNFSPKEIDDKLDNNELKDIAYRVLLINPTNKPDGGTNSLLSP